MKTVRYHLFASMTILLFSAITYAQTTGTQAPTNPDSEPGTIKVFSVQGDVTLVDTESGAWQRLRPGMEFSGDKTIKTDQGSSALLLFSNSSTVSLTPRTSLRIEQFEQVPFDPTFGKYLGLSKEPSKTKTILYLEEGEIAGKTKEAHPESEYTIYTPNASAGTPGSTYVMSTFKNPTTKEPTTIITNAKGKISVTSADEPFEIPVQETVVISGVKIFDPRPARYEEIESAINLSNSIDGIDNSSTNGLLGGSSTPLINVVDPGLNVSPAGG